MPGTPPVKYPNLGEQIIAIAAQHADIHKETHAHAGVHSSTLEAKRRQLALQQAARNLLKAEEKS